MDIKPIYNVSNSRYKSYKHKEMEIAFGKKPINCKLGDLGEARSVYTQTNAVTGKNCITAVHRGNLAFMVPEPIIEELSMASGRTDELKTVDVSVVSMTFFTISKLDKSYPFQYDYIPVKVTSNMKAAFMKTVVTEANLSILILKFFLLVHALF